MAQTKQGGSKVKDIVLRAKLRKWLDRDLEKIVRDLELHQGEMSDLVRVGFRMALVERGLIDERSINND